MLVEYHRPSSSSEAMHNMLIFSRISCFKYFFRIYFHLCEMSVLNVKIRSFFIHILNYLKTLRSV